MLVNCCLILYNIPYMTRGESLLIVLTKKNFLTDSFIKEFIAIRTAGLKAGNGNFVALLVECYAHFDIWLIIARCIATH